MQTQEQDVVVKAKVRRAWYRKRSTLILLLCVIVLVAGSVAASLVYYPMYKGDLAQAQSGAQHLRTAMNLLQGLPKQGLDSKSVDKAQQEFTGALQNFTQVNNSLRSIPSAATDVPVAGSKLGSALRVLPIAIEASQAGQAACTILSILTAQFHNSLNAKGLGLTMANMNTIDQQFTLLKTLFTQITGQVQGLQSSDLQLDPRLGKLVTEFRSNLPALQTGVNAISQVMPVLPELLGVGKPTSYLLELLDISELRPGGGFIGNYGTVTLAGGKLNDAHITDTYLLDNPFTQAGHVIIYPQVYQWFDVFPRSWTLRDTNLDADFPTAARYSEQNYTTEGGAVPVDGVIAITPTFISQALTITGPIAVPEYQETVTAQNLVDRIHYYQLGAGRAGNDTVSTDGHSSVRKRFTELLAEHFMERVRQLPPSSLAKFMQLFLTALPAKDVQIYLNAQAAENVLHAYHLDSSIQSAPGDNLLVVDANMGVDKANAYIATNAVDQVSIDKNGNVTHQTKLTYAWNTQGNIYGSPLYRDYVRVYAPLDSKLLSQSGWDVRGSSTTFGLSTWAGFFTLTYGQTQTITLTWTTPSLVQKNGKSWSYQYLIQHQAGTHWTFNVQIQLPPCAKITSKQGSLQSRGPTLAGLSHTLNKDMQMGLTYSCA